MATIRNPIEWGADQLKEAGASLKTAGHAVQGEHEETAAPSVRRIEISDLRQVLAKGVEDFGANRSDVLFLAIVYPLAGLILSRVAFDYDLLPMLFPLISGFALLGPVAAIGLYELSRRRERGLEVSWSKAFGMVTAPSFGAIVALGLILLGIFMLWLAAAQGIYLWTLGPEPPASFSAFVTARKRENTSVCAMRYFHLPPAVSCAINVGFFFH